MGRSSQQCFSSAGLRPAEFQYEIVRDLYWLIHSPCLMQLAEHLRPDWLFNIPDIDTHLAQLDQNPASIISSLRQQAHFRLGYYFEDLVRIYLKYFIQPSELKSNIQVMHDKTTVGEYDFLVQLKDGRKIHLETAVKFYLCTQDEHSIATPEHFIGPNLSDRLDRKWRRLMEHQLNLSRTSAGNNQAQAIDMVPDQRSLLLRGYLFYHYDNWQHQQTAAPISPGHQRGWWLRTPELDKLKQSSGRYTVLMKPCWLAEAHPHFQNTLSFAELEETTRRITTPLLIARLDQADDRYWSETDRGFLVPENWNSQA